MENMENMRLSLIGSQRSEEGDEITTEISAAAQYYQKNDSLYILYEETIDGNVAKNTLKLKNNVLELTRKGPLVTRMVFEAGKEYITDYATPYGCIKMAILTRTVKADLGKDNIEIRAEYTLASEGRHISDCVITIKLQK